MSWISSLNMKTLQKIETNEKYIAKDATNSRSTSSYSSFGRGDSKTKNKMEAEPRTVESLNP